MLRRRSLATATGAKKGKSMAFRKHTLIVAAGLLLAQSSYVWATGAIAVDDEAGGKPSDAGYGIGFGDDKDSAMKAALKKCRAAGNDNCQVKVWFEGCGAYAASYEKFGVGWDANQEVAEDKALDACGNGRCKVVVSECGD